MKAGNKQLLICKWLGPYNVNKEIGYHTDIFEVLEGTRWYNVDQTTLLMPFRRPGQPQDVHEDEEEICEVEEIVYSRRVKGVVQYRVP